MQAGTPCHVDDAQLYTLEDALCNLVERVGVFLFPDGFRVGPRKRNNRGHQAPIAWYEPTCKVKLAQETLDLFESLRQVLGKEAPERLLT